ncbi:MAG: hypothetical protein F6J90_07835 [Moorea sp. SIOASIH]|uniref:hypothetical protein n=1 Tax=Moorena sp. SIOASIH TaxID=2607817 RepID=UPI0013BCDF3F|nr:hypothetical protein [Moorena sp. SIOASIH]NEO36235.1 hypothetical protein [Moorena sp. SIOASIH]
MLFQSRYVIGRRPRYAMLGTSRYAIAFFWLFYWLYSVSHSYEVNRMFCLLPIAYCLLPIAYCLLPLASCLLPLAYSLLPTPYSLLPTPYSLCYCIGYFYGTILLE